MTARKTVVVTGANRGIGLAICEQILQHHSPVKLYACSRAGKDLGLKPKDSSSDITYPELDITQDSQIQHLASTIKSDDGHLDVLINNAGLNKIPANKLKDAQEIMDINYYGTLNMCQTFLPLLQREHGRIVNVSSTGSSLRSYSSELKGRFRDPNIRFKDIDTLAKSYLDGMSSGNLSDWGNGPPYSASKACVNAMTVALARENPSLLINCCCPGWVATDMGSLVGSPPKTPEEGSRIPVRLGFGDVGGVSGKYWGNPGVYDTGHGEVRPW